MLHIIKCLNGPVLMTFLLMSSAYSQELNFSGTVINTLTGRPVENANIFVENFNSGTTTDSSGKFKINTGSRNLFLVISCVGYEPARINAGRFVSDTVIKLIPVRYLLNEILICSQNEESEGFDYSFYKEQTSLLAGLSKDVLRSVQLLPGVVSNNEANSVVSVRGGSPDENLIMINGIEIHNPFHMREYEITGAGIFNAGMVKKVDFSTGGFPARYGGALSSMLNIVYNHGRGDRFSSTADINLTGINLLLQGPVDKRSSFVLGFRKSFINRMLHLLSSYKNIPDISFYDIQGQIDYNFSPLNKLRFNFIFSRDDFKDYPHTDKYCSYIRETILNNPVVNYTGFNEYTYSDYRSGNVLAGMSSTNFISENISLKSVFSFYREKEDRQYFMDKEGKSEYSGFPDLFRSTSENNKLSGGIRADYLSLVNRFNFYITDNFTLRLGGEIKNIYYGRELRKDGLISVKTNTLSGRDTIGYKLPRNPVYNDTINTAGTIQNINFYLENNIFITGGLSLNLGGRGEYSSLNNTINFSPRFNIAFTLLSGLTIKGAWGCYYQLPAFMRTENNISDLKKIRNSRADHFIIGSESKLGNYLNIRAEIYYKKYSNLIPAERLSDGNINYEFNGNYGKGYAKGIDAGLSFKSADFFCTINYGYLVARENVEGSTGPGYPKFTEQKHTLSFALNYKNRGYEAGASFYYGSGLVFTPEYAVKDDSYITWTQGEKNSSHLPAYIRADLRISMEFKLFNYPMNLYLNIMNIFNKRNVYGYRYGFKAEESEPRVEELKLLPVVPSIGFRYEIN